MKATIKGKKYNCKKVKGRAALTCSPAAKAAKAKAKRKTKRKAAKKSRKSSKRKARKGKR